MSPPDNRSPKSRIVVRRRRASAARADAADRKAAGPSVPPVDGKSRKASRHVGSRPGKIRTGHEDRYVGETPMMRLGRRLVGARSLLALDFLTVTDAFTRDLIDLHDQPEPLDVSVRGETSEWRADYVMSHTDGRRDLVMVRTVRWLEGPDGRRRAWMCDLVDAMALAARRAGYGFRLVTEDQVRVQPRLDNAKMIRRHIDPPRPRAEDVAAIDALADLPDEATVRDLQDRLGPGLDAFPLALRLDWLGHIRMDRGTWFGRTSPFSRIPAASPFPSSQPGGRRP